MSVLTVAGRRIGNGRPPFLVAELSGNHRGSLARALELVDAAAAAGADAVKLQTYSPDLLTLPLRRGKFRLPGRRGPWAGRSLHDLYLEAQTPRAWHEPLFARGRKRGLVCFSTPFDEGAVDFLEALGAPLYKIASFELTDLGLIRKTAATGKPLFISTGMATRAEIGRALRAAREAGGRRLVLLKCTSAYPAEPAEANLRALPLLREAFGVEAGLSDHTLGLAVPLAAVALGAAVIEKHLTLSRAAGGVDAAFSLEPAEFTALAREARQAWQALGRARLGPTPGERGMRGLRRSLYVVQDVKRGERFTPENLRSIRPGGGLAPEHLAAFLGRPAARDVKRGTPAGWKLLKKR